MNAAAAPVRKATASWISKSSVTRVAGDAAVVLDRHEGEEAQELLGAPRGLGLRERRGGEPVERADHVGEPRLPRRRVALGGGARAASSTAVVMRSAAASPRSSA